MNKVKKEFDQGRSHPPIHPLHPHAAGAAIWAKGLLNRINYQMNTLEDAIFLADYAHEASQEAQMQYNQLLSSLEEYIKKVKVN